MAMKRCISTTAPPKKNGRNVIAIPRRPRVLTAGARMPGSRTRRTPRFDILPRRPSRTPRSAAEGANGIEQLPPELLRAILERVSIGNAASLASTSKAFRSAARDHLRDARERRLRQQTHDGKVYARVVELTGSTLDTETHRLQVSDMLHGQRAWPPSNVLYGTPRSSVIDRTGHTLYIWRGGDAGIVVQRDDIRWVASPVLRDDPVVSAIVWGSGDIYVDMAVPRGQTGGVLNIRRVASSSRIQIDLSAPQVCGMVRQLRGIVAQFGSRAAVTLRFEVKVGTEIRANTSGAVTTVPVVSNPRFSRSTDVP